VETGKFQSAELCPTRWLLCVGLAAALTIFSGCGGKDTGAAAVLDLPVTGAELVSPAELTRVASGAQTVSGSEFFRQYGGMVADSNLILTYTPPEPVEDPPAPEPMYYSYATYVVQAIDEQPLTLEVGIAPSNDAEYWVGIVDWPTLSWNFSLGPQPNALSMSIDDLPGGPERVLSPDHTLAVAVVLIDDSAPLKIEFVQVTTISEVSGLAATTDDPDGIALAWDADEDAHGYHVYRRPASTVEDIWEQLTAEPLGMYDSEYFDPDVVESVEYEYRVTKGTWMFVSGVLHWFWSEGAVTLGKRQATLISYPMEGFTDYWPANMWNYMSVFYLPFGAEHHVEGLRNETYPPENEWVHFGGETVGYAHYSLPTLSGFSMPFALHQDEITDNPVITLVATTDDGLWSQVATITPEGMVTWEEPVAVRAAGQHLLGLLKMPRRIGAVTWNTDLSRIELVDSIDLNGRDWYEFDSGTPWHIVSDRMPDGPVECRYFGSGERLAFRERNTNEAVVLARDVGWEDISPGLEIGPAPPAMRFVLAGFTPGYGLIFLAPDSRRIRLLRQTTSGAWLTNEIEELEIAKGGATISEFVMLMSEEISYQNYLIYVKDGNLYYRYTEQPSLAGMTNEYVVDEAGDIRDISAIKVGSGENWESRRYVLYVSDNEQGEPRLHFRDLDEIREPD